LVSAAQEQHTQEAATSAEAGPAQAVTAGTAIMAIRVGFAAFIRWETEKKT
jgi:hypothetical protein